MKPCLRRLLQLASDAGALPAVSRAAWAQAYPRRPGLGGRTITARILFGLTLGTVIGLGQFVALAQSSWHGASRSEDWAHDVTVLTMFGDAWGSATEPAINQAIARAIANCKVMSGMQLGCGASLTNIRAGWSLGIRCGRENIIVADKQLAEAERSASLREYELRAHYVVDMPACIRVVTIDPTGRSVTPELARQLAGRQ